MPPDKTLDPTDFTLERNHDGPILTPSTKGVEGPAASRRPRGEVTVVTRAEGSPDQAAAGRLSMGCDRAVHRRTPMIHGSDAEESPSSRLVLRHRSSGALRGASGRPTT